MPAFEPLSEGGGEARGVLGRRTAGGAGCVRRGVVSSVAVVAERSEWWSSIVAGLLGLTWDGEGRTTTEGMLKWEGKKFRNAGESQRVRIGHLRATSRLGTQGVRHTARETRTHTIVRLPVGNGSHRARPKASQSPRRAELGHLGKDSWLRSGRCRTMECFDSP